MGDILHDIKTVLAGINGRILDGAVCTEDDARFAEAAQRLDQFVADIETEVCPDWDSAPEWAQWWAVDADGYAYWFKGEPHPQDTWGWVSISTLIERDARITLREGYDWRLSLRGRP